MRVLAVVNQKGGVGKTTTCINLAACSALAGWTTLVVDLDPQGNATSGLGIDRSSVEASVYDLLVPASGCNGTKLRDIMKPAALPGLYVLPATIDLAAADLVLANAIARELRLRSALQGQIDDIHLVLIDTPPSLGLLTVNALAAAEGILVPVQCEYYALEGLSLLLDVVALVRSQLNPALQILGAVLTMFDARTRLAFDVAQEVRKAFPGRVFNTVIPRNVRLAEAPSYGQPVVLYDPECAGARAYRDLYLEVFGDEETRVGEGLGGAAWRDSDGTAADLGDTDQSA
ncbi:MAG: ParA family protein [Armatimonadetes bacterium]|nr:ParA family protein [Armatimonadota bacterium]